MVSARRSENTEKRERLELEESADEVTIKTLMKKYSLSPHLNGKLKKR